MLPDKRQNVKNNHLSSGVASDKEPPSVTSLSQPSYFFLTLEGPYLFRKEPLPRKFIVSRIITGVVMIAATCIAFYFFIVYPFVGGPTVSRFIPVAVLFMIFMVPLFPFIVFGIFQSLKIKKIKREGQVLFGKLLEINTQVKGGGAKGSGPRFVVTVRFGFTSPEGESITAIDSENREDLIGKKLAATGTPVVIIYLNRRSYLLL